MRRTLLLSQVLILISISARAQTDRLDLPDQYIVGGEPWSVFAADLNGDLLADLATVSYQTDSLTVLLNNGDGTFSPSGTYLTDHVPVYVHGADIDGDSAVDLAVANTSSNTISLFVNNGDGTFAAPTTVASGTNPTSIRLTDLNNDGFQDLVATTNDNSAPLGDDRISVLLGNGDGTFQARSTYRVGEEPQESVAADFNGDEFLDLAAVNLMTHTVSVLINDGDGTFGSDTQYESHHMPSGLSCADLNGDDYPDLIAPNSDAYEQSVIAVILGNGDGTFQSTRYVNSGGFPFDTFVCDLDRDDDIDVIVANWATDKISLLFNNGDATFEDPVEYTAGDNPKALFAADLNNDTYPDLTVANRDSDDILIYRNQGEVSDVETEVNLVQPDDFWLSHPWPNPFNPQARVAYRLPRRAHVRLTLHNILGQEVAVLVYAVQSSGVHQATWDVDAGGTPAASGIYFLRLATAETSATRKLLLVR